MLNSMHKYWMPLCITAFSLMGQPVHANEIGVPVGAAELNGILDNGIGGRTIPPEKRADLSTCNGAEEAGLVRAINTCWPVLETYRLYTLLRPAGEAWKALPAARQRVDTPEARNLSQAIQSVISSAEGRAYPAQDMPLITAYILKATLSVSLGDAEGSLVELTKARDIVATSRIEGFSTNTSYLRIIDRLTAAVEKELGR
ncbi:hypothetical protein [Sphingopyxis sp. H012]|uniref:hypothetical protein n=2 Tax=Sphingopyxis TaxID=165697 RepID=UPI000A5F979D|nr:hypothetical protein [Sphingopyxis sp. H012]